ncbi:MAG: hypothetical protein P9L97_06065 [Candidatus Tenebribacter davisii]|nr:hypothetical protein [Candidatus Tenebribacter davisii]
MTLAERNWNYNLQNGNFGVGGNFFQAVKHIAADYSYNPGDGLLCIDTSVGNVTITLPPIAGWPNQDYRIILPIMHTAGLNGVYVQLSGDETFLLGNTTFLLGAAPFSFDFYVINSDDLSTYGLISDLTIKATTAMVDAFAAASWATIAVIPFGIELENTGPELLVYQADGSGVIASAVTGTGIVTFTDEAHGLSVGETITIAGTTSYNDEYVVTAIPDVDTFSIAETFVADESGTWTRSARYTVLAPGLYTMSFTAQIDSTGGAAWGATGSIYVDDTIISNAIVSVSGIAGENKSMNLVPVETYLTAGQVVTVKMDNDTLTGDLTEVVLNIAMKAL